MIFRNSVARWVIASMLAIVLVGVVASVLYIYAQIAANRIVATVVSVKVQFMEKILDITVSLQVRNPTDVSFKIVTSNFGVSFDVYWLGYGGVYPLLAPLPSNTDTHVNAYLKMGYATLPRGTLEAIRRHVEAGLQYEMEGRLTIQAFSIYNFDIPFVKTDRFKAEWTLRSDVSTMYVMKDDRTSSIRGELHTISLR